MFSKTVGYFHTVACLIFVGSVFGTKLSMAAGSIRPKANITRRPAEADLLINEIFIFPLISLI